MNGFPESETAEHFATDNYQALIVAGNFQKGFDQPQRHVVGPVRIELTTDGL